MLALAVEPNGDVIAGGTFWGFGGVSMRGVVRWNGTTWSPFGSGLPNASVHGLALLGNGDLVVGGQISIADGDVARNIARWDGFGWSPLGAGVVYARQMAVTLTGDLVVGCRMAVPGGPDIPTPARWDGTGWSALGSGFGPNHDDAVSALLARNVYGPSAVLALQASAGGQQLLRSPLTRTAREHDLAVLYLPNIDPQGRPGARPRTGSRARSCAAVYANTRRMDRRVARMRTQDSERRERPRRPRKGRRGASPTG